MNGRTTVPKPVWIIGIGVALFLIFPIFVVIPISFSSATYLEFPPSSFSLQWYERYFTDTEWVGATLRSFWVAAAVAVLSTTLGTMAAFALVRGNFFGRSVIFAFILSPLIVPLIVTGIALYFTLAKLGLIGSPMGLIIAHTVVTIPLAVVVMTASLSGFDMTLEQAAASLGGNRFYVLRRVTLPMVAPGIATAGVLTFLTSFDEVVIAIFISGTDAVTLPKKMWEGVWLEITPTIAAASSLLIVFTIVIFICIDWLQRRGEALKRGINAD